MARKTNLLLENAENDDIRFSINGNGSSITNTYINKGDDISKIDAGFSFAYPSSLSGVGVFNDDITIDICYDNSCQYHLDGSPLKISTKYEINFDPPEGVDTANIVDKQELKHDIVDAEYSKSLDAVVMVSSYPDNAVYIYNVNNKTEQKINLNKPPKAVSVDFVNSRKRFAIGHDSGATIVDYNDVDPGSSVVKYIVVSVNVYDLAVNQDNVFIVPSEGQWVDLIELDILNETESYGDYLIDDNSKIKLHASGNSVYTTETNSSPIDIEKFDISNSPPPKHLYDSPYHGDYAMCGDLWLDDGGNRIYTKCGNTFKSTGLQETDMTYSGKINLTQVDSYDHYQIRSLSDFPTHNEIALIEYKDDSIDSYITKLRTYYHDFYNEIAEVALPTEWVNSKPYLNEPQFVFYTSDGRKIVVSKVQGIPTATSNILEIQ